MHMPCFGTGIASAGSCCCGRGCRHRGYRGSAVLAPAFVAAVCADAASSALLAPVLVAAVCADAEAPALFAAVLDSTMLADRATPARFALALDATMPADLTAAALLALVLPSTMFADAGAAALLAPAPQSAMLADAGAAALLALDSTAVVLADDLTMAVPAHCTAALGLAAAAIVAVGASAGSITSAIDGASAVPLQPVDQVLLLPGLRQWYLRAELLQLRDGLRAGKHKAKRVSLGARAAGLSRGKQRCGQGTERQAITRETFILHHLRL